MNNQSLITLNVGGLKFVTHPSTLQRFPESRLARMLSGNDSEFRLVNGHFFVDRDGVLFSYILDILRTLKICLPSDFSDYQRLRREAEFYELYPVVDLLSQEHLLKPKQEILEIRFLLKETQAFFRVFCSSSPTIDELAGRITVFEQKLTRTDWINHAVPSQKSLKPILLEKCSHHDLIFQCGTDHSDQSVSRYVSIKPDQRKLYCGANLLGLLMDILLREGFCLVSTRTVTAEEKVECYCFQRTKQPEALTVNTYQMQQDSTEPQGKATETRKNK